MAFLFMFVLNESDCHIVNREYQIIILKFNPSGY